MGKNLELPKMSTFDVKGGKKTYTMSVPDGTDKNGNPKYKQVNVKEVCGDGKIDKDEFKSALRHCVKTSLFQPKEPPKSENPEENKKIENFINSYKLEEKIEDEGTFQLLIVKALIALNKYIISH